MGQFHWRPEEYLALMREEVPQYERLQDEAAVATGYGAARVLELGTGTGETARRVLELHPLATLVGVDASSEMLERAAEVLPPERVELRAGRLEDPLPAGPFDVVVSVLAVHHLDGAGKADLFSRAREVLKERGRIVVGDVVVPEDPADAVTPIDGDYDKPSTVAEQLGWLQDAGYEASVAWSNRDLAVLVGER
ncbi:MAG TPA: class I SAM-dependent methyltransferase [Thermoleophilaceae bacterium]